MYARPPFVNGNIYHVYNRGVAKQTIFHNDHDYRHFFETLAFYLDIKPTQRLSKTVATDRQKILKRLPEEPLAEVLSYCLMSNHFHLLLRQLAEGGISDYMRRSLNSYSRAYNTKYDRVGSAFQGVFSAVAVESDEQFLHVTRYIHLNPFVARLAAQPGEYHWSSYPTHLSETITRMCNPSLVLSMVGGSPAYRAFVEDYASYVHDIGLIKDLLIDRE